MSFLLKFKAYKWIFSAVPTLLFGGMVGCSGGGQFGSSGDKQSDPDSNAEDTKSENSDEADVPVIVAGSYLTCEETETDLAKADELSWGCRLADRKTDKTVPLQWIASDWKWRSAASKDDKILVRIEEDRSKDAHYQAFYLFGGAPDDELRAYAENTNVILNADFKSDLPGVEYFSRRIGREVDKAAARAMNKSIVSTNASDLSTPDVSASQEEGNTTTDNQDGNLTDKDGDGVEDAQDLCSQTPSGQAVHTTGEWSGCASGEYKDKDDLDLDGVPNSVDRCPDTDAAKAVDTAEESPTLGCSSDQDPVF